MLPVTNEFVPYFPYFFSCGFHPSCWDSSCAMCHYSVSQKMKVGGDYSFETSQDPPLWGPGMESLATRVLCTVLVCFHKGRNVTYSYGQVMVAVGTELAEHCVLIPLIQKTIWEELMQ